MLDVKFMTGMFSVNWIKALKKAGGLDFLLKCDFDVRKLPLRLLDFLVFLGGDIL